MIDIRIADKNDISVIADIINETWKVTYKDIVSEKEGIKLCISFMKEILDVQVDSDEEQDIKIMSQIYVPKVGQ